MKPIHIDLSQVDLDFEGQWIEVRKPLGWTMRRVEQWQRLESTDNTAVQEEFLRWLITAWHIVDQDSGEWLNDPAADDLKALTPGMFLGVRDALKDPFRGGLAPARDQRPDLRVVDRDPGGAPSAT